MSRHPDMGIEIAGIRMKNPVTVASATHGRSDLRKNCTFLLEAIRYSDRKLRASGTA